MSRERDESDDRDDTKLSDQNNYFVKLHGISSSLNEDDIKQFLSPCHVTTVHLFDNEADNPLLNKCFVELESETDVKDALKKSGTCINRKEIEVRRTTSHEYNFYVKQKGIVTWREPVIRMSGLPSVCTMGNVQNFFENIVIARNGIYITRDMSDQALGNGFVAFVDMDNAYKAIDTHDQKRLQHRYIELFPSTYEEAKRRIMDDARANARQFVGEDDIEENNKTETIIPVDKQNSRSRSRSRRRSRSTSHGDYRQRDMKRRHSPSVSPPPRSRPPPRNFNQRSYNNNNNNNNHHRNRRSRSRSPARRSPARRSSSRHEEFVVKIRGMPYTVVEEDVRKFFPSSCQPARIEISQDRRMKRPNGNGYLYYNTIEEVDEAMKFDRKYMGSRYVELYFDSPRYATLTNRRKKPEGNFRRTSRSPSKSRYNRRSRSRSDSMD